MCIRDRFRVLRIDAETDVAAQSGVWHEGSHQVQRLERSLLAQGQGGSHGNQRRVGLSLSQQGGQLKVILRRSDLPAPRLGVAELCATGDCRDADRSGARLDARFGKPDTARTVVRFRQQYSGPTFRRVEQAHRCEIEFTRRQVIDHLLKSCLLYTSRWV